jgi:CopG family transcriptional regulator, nickel-responsive regulator
METRQLAIEVRMGEVRRFGVSIDDDLLDRFDRLIEAKGYANRSEALRDLIRDRMVDEEWSSNAEVVGSITVVYSHHVRELTERLNELQHHHYSHVLSSLHVHLDPENCLEVIVVRGPAAEIRALADTLIGARGVKHGKLVMSTTGAEL